MSKKDDFLEPYSRVSLAEVLELHKSEKVSPALRLARLQSLNRWFSFFVGTRGAHENEHKSEKIREFEKNYGRELEFIYSNHLLDEISALQRLKEPGKFRIIEPLLMVKYDALPLRKLVNYLNPEDWDLLSLSKDKKGEYFIPGDFFDKKIEKLDNLIKSANEISSDYRLKFDEGLARFKLNELSYEKDIFLEYVLKERHKL